MPDCLTFYLLSIYPMDDFDNRPQLDRDLHMGKIMWAVNKAMCKEVFTTNYVKTISDFVKRNPKITVRQLLEDEDYSPIKAIRQRLIQSIFIIIDNEEISFFIASL